MKHEMNLAVVSERVRAPTYEELYGRATRSAAASRSIPRGPGLRRFVAVGVVAVCAMLLVGQRQRIVRHAPALAGLYALGGLPVNVRGLAFRDVKSMLLQEDAQRVLAVEGQVANLRDTAVSVPDMRISVAAPDGREIYAWTAKSPKPRLEAGETAYFRARLNAPPAEGEAIKVRFADSAAMPPLRR
jgi:hypothetical protein